MPTYSGLIVYQRPDLEALPLFVFAAPAREILSWAKILRTADVHGAAQRTENKAHVKNIRSYMNAAPDNIIPTSVTLAVDERKFTVTPVPTDHARLSILSAQLEIVQPSGSADADKPAYVIDGQHRLLAMAQLAGNSLVLATVILGADSLERALHFVVINNKAKRVSSDLVQGIVAELPDADRRTLYDRLTAIGLTLGTYPSALEVLGRNQDSPFYELIDWDINREGTKRIKPLALETALRTIRASLRTTDPVEVDDAVGLLCAMWLGVSKAWAPQPQMPQAWHHEKSKLADKASIVAVTEFFVDRLNVKCEEGFDITDLGAVQKFCHDVISGVPAMFWLVEWNKTGLDTSAGRDLIKTSLAEVRMASASNLPDPVEYATLIGKSKSPD